MLKQTMILISLLFLGISTANSAISVCGKNNASCPLVLSGPVPAIHDLACNGAHETIVYTLTNNTPSKINISKKVFKQPNNTSDATVSISGGTCGNSISADSSCTIEVTITAPASCMKNQHVSWELMITPNSNQQPLVAPIDLNAKIPPMIAVGEYINTIKGAAYPMVTVSTDNGSTWNYLVTDMAPVELKFGGSLLKGSCSGLLCIAAGVARTDTISQGPLLVMSQDGGETWIYVDVPLPSDAGTFEVSLNGGVSCAGQVCVAAGVYFSQTNVQYPYAIATQDGGNTWQNVINSNTPALPTDFDTTPTPVGKGGLFNDVSCSGLTCIAVGNYYANSVNGYALLAQSQDGGQTWSYVVDSSQPALPPGYATFSGFFSASCSGSVCIAGGRYDSYPLVAVSQNNGQAWTYVVNKDYPSAPADFTSGDLSSVSCSGLNCIAGGSYSSSTSTYPFLASSQNGGQTWAYVIDSTTPVLPPSFQNSFITVGFEDVSCSALVCTAAGAYVYNNMTHNLSLLIATSANGGASWIYTNTYTQRPSDLVSGAYSGVSCQGTVCIAGGQYRTSPTQIYPLLAVSQDSGQTWQYKINSTVGTLPPDYANRGIFYSTNANVIQRFFYGVAPAQTLDLTTNFLGIGVVGQ